MYFTRPTSDGSKCHCDEEFCFNTTIIKAWIAIKPLKGYVVTGAILILQTKNEIKFIKNKHFRLMNKGLAFDIFDINVVTKNICIQ